VTAKPDHFAETGTVGEAEQARRGSRPAYWGEGFVDTPVFDGSILAQGAEITGPALIEEPFTVVVLPPDASAQLDATGSYVINV
jgi:N-methylhydantoinase A/oxoprolinase/acetone carboxylase beta subunit